MKILTINMHSYIEKESEEKLEIFVGSILKIQPDIIAMQEINQRTFMPFSKNRAKQYGIKMKEDNYALRINKELSRKGCEYTLFWVGIKRGFFIFDEGICFLSKIPVEDSEAFLISETNNNTNWRKRMALGIKVDGEWFYNVHMGRWDDEEEPFLKQFTRLNENVKKDSIVWLMGDFNAPFGYKNEGYDMITSSGFYDTYELAENKDAGYTITGKIDGWNDKKDSFKNQRIDYIFTNKKRNIKSSFVVFDGKNEKVISDHNGILLTY